MTILSPIKKKKRKTSDTCKVTLMLSLKVIFKVLSNCIFAKYLRVIFGIHNEERSVFIMKWLSGVKMHRIYLSLLKLRIGALWTKKYVQYPLSHHHSVQEYRSVLNDKEND
ncbi:uncharacterized protein LOC118180223 [Stegodyphus dumicola]|uniref:uncharacterized protein LOC118180223 n=1 Tax=Stegodyphus dumicola TaxID=202533 RepID=UPI0015AAEC4A|nr:uncharacterized protein LOC118180223 [Stegodyphus dumicola]